MKTQVFLLNTAEIYQTGRRQFSPTFGENISMANKKKVPDEVITEAYLRLKNVWLVGKEVGLCGQSVHERTTKLGLQENINIFTPEEKERLKNEYSKRLLAGELQKLADEMGRTKPFICRQARALGLTDIGRSKKEVATYVSQGHFFPKGCHPKGFKGHKHTDAAKEIISAKSILSAQELKDSGRLPGIIKQMMESRHANNTYSPERKNVSWKSGWREIGGKRKYFRSRWEANYARYMELLKGQGDIKDWEHEPEVFWFEGIKRGCMSYLPDFRITNKDNTVEFHEVKGWMDDRSKTKINRMRIYHPSVKLLVRDSKWFSANTKKLKGLIRDWE